MSSSTLSRVVRAVAVTGVCAAALVPATQRASAATVAVPAVPHLMASLQPVHASGGGASPNATQLQYKGGPIQHSPGTYLIFWGAQWQVGWTDVSNGGHTYTSAQEKAYITNFFTSIGGTTANGFASQTQYCSGVAVGSTSAACGGHTLVGNPPVLRGVWNDTTSTPPPPVVPDNCVVLVCFVPGSSLDSANLLGQEAIRAEAHFGGYVADSNYIILLPKLTDALGGDTAYCAYHSEIGDGLGHEISFTNQPLNMDANINCGENFVNSTDSASGQGFMDGYSMVAGHEEAETMTDPLPFTNPAWQDSSGSETGDKCAWISSGPGAAHNIGGFAEQTYWSDAANAGSGGCV